jgi:hypothetical protein
MATPWATGYSCAMSETLHAVTVAAKAFESWLAP